MTFIQIENLSFEYSSYASSEDYGGGSTENKSSNKNNKENKENKEEERQNKVKFKALDNINLNIEEGSFVAILGHNGSGKSTLAKHFSGILLGTDSESKVLIDNMDTRDENNLWEIKKNVGIVFQNPDNQIVASIVEDDIAFGVENLGIEREEMKYRIDFALKAVNMKDFKKTYITNLSGGQKQRIAIAGILAMQPRCIVLDEPTAMLDPSGRKEVINIIKKLNKEKKITIILITHFMEEVVDADRLIVMEKGKILLDDRPIEVFKNIEQIKSIKLDVPEALDISNELNKLGHRLPLDVLKLEDLAENLYNYGFNEDVNNGFNEDINNGFNEDVNNGFNEDVNNNVNIKIENVSHVYSKNTIFEKIALCDINLDIYEGDFLGIIGHTGSGKSTLIQMLNALIRPSEGNIYINRENIYNNNNINIKDVRRKVGVVFQYPEYQLFEETVFKDVAFAPTNMNLSEDEINKRVIEALKFVSIDETYYNKSPFELSGGQKRRVAIAGILAMKPDVLVFDELTAGLDPFTREEILSQIVKMQKKLNITVVLVSHSMEDVARVCNRIVVLNKSKCVLNSDTNDVFKNNKLLEEIGLDVPKYSKLFDILNKKYNLKFDTSVYRLEDCIKVLDKNLDKNKNKKGGV